MGYGPWGREESNISEQLTLFFFFPKSFPLKHMSLLWTTLWEYFTMITLPLSVPKPQEDFLGSSP